MRKIIDVTIDQSTWHAGGPSLPPTFHTGTQPESFNMSEVFLLLGNLTTPTVSSGASLSEFWAWVRYFFALSEAPDMRITEEFAELDAHQKMILSDDFGVGLSMWWLAKKLSLIWFCDGRDFVERFSSHLLPATQTLKKRGPSKCPDFVCLDSLGLLHVIECKGTQTSAYARERQFLGSTSYGSTTGGRVQKRVVKVAPPWAGQALACGALVARESAEFKSDLKIVDPEGDPVVTVAGENYKEALDPILRSTIARNLRAVGFRDVANVIAAPSGPRPGSREGDYQFDRLSEDLRLEFIEERRHRARVELQMRLSESDLVDDGQRYLKSAVELPLPQPLHVGPRVYRRVRLTHGVDNHLVKLIGSRAIDDERLLTDADEFRELLETFKIDGGDDRTELRTGDGFFSRIELLEE